MPAPLDMTPDPTSHDILASWQYTPDEWRRFGEYEGRHYRKVIGQTKTFFIALVIMFIAVLAMVPVFGFLRIVPWDRYMLNAVFVIVLVGVGFMGLIFVIWMIQRSKLASLSSESGKVAITFTGININGIWNTWTYDTTLGQRFYDARTMTINENKPNEMELLEVRTIANTLSGKVARDVISSHRVPIPRGKRAEAETIVGKIISEKNRLSA
ncbi:MAG TPA: hypothetical protein VNA17_08945 [Pyrinomonadaceae bacterium]|nr:hypothetical protein [Pyrinomonadaceae bacterium]